MGVDVVSGWERCHPGAVVVAVPTVSLYRIGRGYRPPDRAGGGPWRQRFSR